MKYNTVDNTTNTTISYTEYQCSIYVYQCEIRTINYGKNSWIMNYSAGVHVYPSIFRFIKCLKTRGNS